MIRRATLIACFTLTLLGPPRRSAHAFTDYDPASSAWNGTRELVRVASESNVELTPTTTLDWDRIRPDEGLLVLYPTVPLELDDLSAFLEDGGRVAWFDDFGASQDFLDWFQFHRDPVVQGVPRAPDLPELLLAHPVGAHTLTDGVDVLVTNIPTAVSHPRLHPLFEFDPPDDSTAHPEPQGLMLVAVIGHESRGRLVVSGDPSILLNTMLRFAGNRQFAHNLVTFLAGHPGGRVTLVWGNVHVHGSYRSRHPHPRGRSPARRAVNTLNDVLVSANHTLAAPALARPLAVFLMAGVALVLAVVTSGRRPSERYGPRGPEGTSAGVTDRIALFGRQRANMLYPALVARRVLERALMRASGVDPPTDVRTLLDHVRVLSDVRRREVRTLLAELDALGEGADDGPVARLSTPRFLSLWRRIDAILADLGGNA